jgi:hypothetical protein
MKLQYDWANAETDMPYLQQNIPQAVGQNSEELIQYQGVREIKTFIHIFYTYDQYLVKMSSLLDTS